MSPIFCPLHRSALMLALVGSLAACVGTNPRLSAADRIEILSYVPEADLTNLTPAQEHALANTLHSSDGLHLATELRAVLNMQPLP